MEECSDSWKSVIGWAADNSRTWWVGTDHEVLHASYQYHPSFSETKGLWFLQPFWRPQSSSPLICSPEFLLSLTQSVAFYFLHVSFSILLCETQTLTDSTRYTKVCLALPDFFFSRFISMSIYWCEYISYMCGYLQMQEQEIRSPGTEVAGSGEPPFVATWNWTVSLPLSHLFSPLLGSCRSRPYWWRGNGPINPLPCSFT